MAITSLSSKRSNLLGVLALSRPRNLAIAAVTLLLIRYGWMTRWNTGGASLQTSVFQIFEATLVMVLLMAAGNIINAYFDVQEDRINRPQRAIVDRTVKRRVLIFTHQVLNLLGLLIALHLSWGLGSWGRERKRKRLVSVVSFSHLHLPVATIFCICCVHLSYA